MTNPKCVILRGTPGSGKSTWTKKNHPHFVVVSTDHYFLGDLENPHEYRFDPTKLGEAHAQCLRRFVAMVDLGQDVVVDNTNTTAVEMSPYVALAQMKGYDVRIVYIKCDPFLAARRNTHGVPDRSVMAMHARLQDPLPFHWPTASVIQTG